MRVQVSIQRWPVKFEVRRLLPPSMLESGRHWRPFATNEVQQRTVGCFCVGRQHHCEMDPRDDLPIGCADAKALEQLIGYDWTGRYRESGSAIQRTCRGGCAMSTHSAISMRHFASAQSTPNNR